ncbi:hypothetical protein FRC12_000417 [Ceratobasidium sp. 428]|nr:hypothetical protein FRC12_000417 [Ceratobasidium sp. 428]
MRLPKLSNILSKPTRIASKNSFELLAAAESDPEPTSTLAGTAPGNALFDSPQAQSSPKPSGRSHRVKTPTEKGAYWTDLVSDSQQRSGKIRRTKARKAQKSAKSAKSASSVGDDSDGCLTTSTVDTGLKSLPPMRIITPGPRVGRAPSGAAAVRSDVEANTGAAGPGEGAGAGEDAAEGTTTYSRPSSRASSAVPGTPGEDEEPQHRNFLDGIDTTRPESSHHDLVESIPNTQLVEELLKYTGNRQYAETLSSQTIEAMLEVYNADRSRTIPPPVHQQIEAELLSQNATGVGGGNHRDLMEIYDNGSGGTKRPSSAAQSNPKRQRVTIEEVPDIDAFCPPDPDTGSDTKTNTDTETETESEPEPEPKPRRPVKPTPTINQVAESPSPLPRSHVPIDPSIRDTLDFSPFGAPAKPSGRPLTRKTTSATEIVTPETPPPPGRLSRQALTSTKPAASKPTATKPTSQAPKPKPGRLATRVLASLKSTVHPLPRPVRPTSTSALPRPDSSQVELTRKRSEASQRAKQAKRAAHESGTSTQAAPPPELSAADKRKLDILKDAGKVARMVREQYRRQAVARTAGIRLPELDPTPSECDPLETDLVHDNEENRATKAAEASGEAPAGRKRKPSARDLFGYQREIILAAKTRLLAHSLKEGALQTRGTFAGWSIKCWLDSMAEVTPHLDPHPPTSDIQQIMINGLASGRGRFKDPVRSLVEYRCDFIKPATTAEEINHNLAVFKSLHPNSFHCLRQNPDYGHYENPLLTHAIAATVFANSNAPGAVHPEMFNPVQLTTVAFVLAIIQFCLEEWETGQFQARDLSMTDMLNKYVAHLRGLKEARAAAKGRMKRLQQHWFKFGYEYSGAVRPEEPYRQPITLRANVRPDTPEFESDDGEEFVEDAPEVEEPASEPEVDDEGRYTAAAKGKGRA